MSDLDNALASARTAVDEMIRTAAATSAAWTTPRAPGKWSPSRVVEHVARSLEASADDIAGRPCKFPNLPLPLRFLARSLLFNRVLRKGSFPRAKTNAAMDPVEGPATPADAATRLDAAWSALSEACAVTYGPEMQSVVFGRVPLVDYLRFQEIHTRHHQKQMTWS